ncbi:MAG: hypothetical protein GWP17_03035 [Aquificales bacterium]|nr:hypothetical protein [Aquificales bacterium]
MKPGEGVIGAISKKATGTGGHFWVATEYLSTSGEEKNAVMHLTAAGGLGDSQSGGSGESSGSRGVGDLAAISIAGKQWAACKAPL